MDILSLVCLLRPHRFLRTHARILHTTTALFFFASTHRHLLSSRTHFTSSFPLFAFGHTYTHPIVLIPHAQLPSNEMIFCEPVFLNTTLHDLSHD